MAVRKLVRRRSPSDDVLLGEVARVLGIARSTAWARVIRGDIPAEYRGGRYIVQRRLLNRLVAEKGGREKSGASAA
jgi:hypothetical protein